MDLAMAIGMTAYQAYHGEGSFGEPVTGSGRWLRSTRTSRTSWCGADSPVSSVADFARTNHLRRRCRAGTEALSQHVLAAFGLTYDDITPRYLSFAESSSALQDGAIDGAIISVGYPAAAVLEATTTSNIRLSGHRGRGHGGDARGAPLLHAG
jgi:uncharacterized protein